MKKFLTLILILLIGNIVSAANYMSTSDNKLAISKRISPIEDEFIKSDVFPKVMPKYIKNNEPIVDELINESPNSDNPDAIKLWVRKNGKTNKILIEDELINPQFKSKYTSFARRNILKNTIEDNFAKNNIDRKSISAIRTKSIYDFTKKQIPVRLKIIKNVTTKRNLAEGDKIVFKTTDEVMINGRLLPKGTKVIGNVETISESDKMGTPFTVIIDNFHLEDNPDVYFYGNISKTGANRSIWVYPLYQAGNICFYVAGFAFVPIHGGHAKVHQKETFTVFYETK